MKAIDSTPRPRQPLDSTRGRSWLGSLAAGVVTGWIALSPTGCSSDPPATPGCDPSLCAAGNECLSDGKETKCRLPCELRPDGTGGHASCPFNYRCVEASPKPFCVADARQLVQRPGLWGTPCLPTDGIENPACDAEQGFYCYGQSPTDAAAYCTIYDCETDDDCKAGWWCATVNEAPNLLNRTRSIGVTRRVCQPRGYCAICRTDLDCPNIEGVRQRCMLDQSDGGFCAPECTSDTGCPNDAECLGTEAIAPSKVCYPRAGGCVGDGSLCSPCRSDDDCRGICVKSEYSTERFCAVKSKIPCGVDEQDRLVADCPTSNVANAEVGCVISKSDRLLPKDYCVGLVMLGDANQPGCFTRQR